MSNQKTLGVDKEMHYNNFRIFHNQWGEYCVCRKMTGSMVSWNAGFPTLAKAKEFVNIINPEELDQKSIEEVATKLKGNRASICYCGKPTMKASVLCEEHTIRNQEQNEKFKVKNV